MFDFFLLILTSKGTLVDHGVSWVEPEEKYYLQIRNEYKVRTNEDEEKLE